MHVYGGEYLIMHYIAVMALYSDGPVAQLVEYFNLVVLVLSHSLSLLLCTKDEQLFS